MALLGIALVLSAVSIIHNQIAHVAATEIGINYGLLGNDLPPPPEVVQLYKSVNINKVRLFDPNAPALNALRGSNISVIVGIRNEDLAGLAASQDAVNAWVATNIEPYLVDTLITYITVGNEVIPGAIGPNVLPVMQLLRTTLQTKNLLGIKVSTVLPANVLGVSFPPSAGAFTPETAPILRGILEFLTAQGWPLMINVYPYFAYAADPVNVRLDYAQFTATGVVVQDGPFGYTNLFDAIVDAFISAMEKENGGNVSVVVSETGWPSAGNGEFTTPALAGTYNGNLIKHIEAKVGTPKRPGAFIDSYIFATFNENQKPPGVEQNFGLFFPSKAPVYPIF
ncbi:probable glucan endo-1,3-beta-glucosidase BG4 [Ziziphus jujuba]|uniref:glucan endo-1,3-beta-D-glucosidase n=2 Tax=Ziziphus jujuba TaxID=326968 RepID=A0A6P4A6F2_ZIZJJ|nr:probable glucan endo-1,3-beta-glucosidase BG4 [Ziziphus jujuba]KAH7519282.1 hypothetical protein FEM48_Zijuj08G0019500 [Ziziphus jujuba var. spinosa]